MARLVSCPDCGTSVSTKATSCPKCGRVLRKPARRYGCGTLLLIGFLAFIGLAMLAGRNRPPRAAKPPVASSPVPGSSPTAAPTPVPAPTTPAPAPTPAPTLQAGDEAIVHIPGNTYVFLAAEGDEKAWDEMLDAENRNDIEDLSLLIARGRVLQEANGVRAKVLKRGFTSTLVRIRGGNNPGREGWVQVEFVKPAPQGR